jgi:hypothetical protein
MMYILQLFQVDIGITSTAQRINMYPWKIISMKTRL